MKLFTALGAKDEGEALKIVAAFNEFSDSLKALTGQETSGGIVGVVTAWKQAATTDAERRADEGKRVSETIDALKASGVRGADALKATYEASGYGAFKDAADQAEADHKSGAALIEGLVSEKRLAPAAKASFEKLWQNHGIEALRAAAEALPAALLSGDPAPIPTGASGLTPSEEARAAKMTPEARAKFIELRASRRKES